MSTGQGARLPSLLRELRTRAGLGQEELAARARVSVRTIRELERGRVSHPQPATMRLLADALGLQGMSRTMFLGSAQAAEEVDRGRLPRRELIGRDEEVAQLCALARDVPVVTLVGVAGIGKTALALGIGQRLVERDGMQAGLVAVSREATPDDLRAAVTGALGGTEAGKLADHLAGRATVVIVDAAEAAPTAAADTVCWLRDLPGQIHVLVTSRHPLGVRDEYRRAVTPLPVPPAGLDANHELLSRYPASRLFLARSRRIRAESFDTDDLSVLAALVRRLGGHPLAIELMAARTRMLSLADIARRYGTAPLSMTITGHGTAEPSALRTVIADSYRVLDPAEQRTLRQLSVFHGPWRVEAAERLISADDPITILDRLADHGMVTLVDPEHDQRRFRLLDIVRDYAAEQLTAAGEHTLVQERHAALYARILDELTPMLSGAAMGETLHRIDEEIAELNGALIWAGNNDPSLALAIASGLARYWRIRGTPAHGRRWLDRLLDEPACAQPSRTRLSGLIAACQLAGKERTTRAALRFGEQALRLARELRDESGELAARAPLTRLLRLAGRYDRARDNARDALRLATRLGDVRAQIREQTNLIWDQVRLGELAPARRDVTDLRQRAQRFRDPMLNTVLDLQLAEIETLDMRFAAAEQLMHSSLQRARAIEAPDRAAAALCALALLCSIDRRPVAARPALDEATRLAERLRLSWLDGLVRQSAGFLALAEGDLTDAARHFRALLDTPRYDYRNEIESRVGLLIAEHDDPARRRANRDELAGACQRLQVCLSPCERHMLSSHRVDPAGLPFARTETVSDGS